jgi:hypothetical protein
VQQLQDGGGGAVCWGRLHRILFEPALLSSARASHLVAGLQLHLYALKCQQSRIHIVMKVEIKFFGFAVRLSVEEAPLHLGQPLSLQGHARCCVCDRSLCRAEGVRVAAQRTAAVAGSNIADQLLLLPKLRCLQFDSLILDLAADLDETDIPCNEPPQAQDPRFLGFDQPSPNRTPMLCIAAAVSLNDGRRQLAGQQQRLELLQTANPPLQTGSTALLLPLV